MCLSKNTVTILKNQYIGNPFSENDYVWVEKIYNELWTNLDHTFNYCINPKTMIGELLKRSNLTQYQVYWPKNNPVKSQRYEEIMIKIMKALPNSYKH